MIVLDASVLVKLFKNEEDSAIARQFIDIQLLEKREPFLAPSILIYETLSAALHEEQPFDRITVLLERLQTLGLTIKDPEAAELVLAEKIARTEAPGAGSRRSSTASTTRWRSIAKRCSSPRIGGTPPRPGPSATSCYWQTGGRTDCFYSAARWKASAPLSNCNLARRA